MVTKTTQSTHLRENESAPRAPTLPSHSHCQGARYRPIEVFGDPADYSSSMTAKPPPAEYRINFRYYVLRLRHALVLGHKNCISMSPARQCNSLATMTFIRLPALP
jgi:hypothetical protein